MKKITLITLALFSLLLTQCKKEKIDSNSGDVKMVQVKCEVPISDGSKTDFTNLLTDGTIKWSEGTESLYFPINGNNHQIITLSGQTSEASKTLTFTGTLPANTLEDGSIHEIWYLGTAATPSVDISNGTTVSMSGSINWQSGKIEELGKYHIAKGEVKVNIADDGSVSLLLKGRLKNQIAIAYMDLTNIRVLEGSAIIGTNFALEYSDSDGKYVFNVDKNSNKFIYITEENQSEAFVVFFPNIPEDNEKIQLLTDISRYFFENGIEANGLYYASDENDNMTTLEWETFYNENGYEYVDLGLPSGTKWAKYNIGVDSENLQKAEDYYGAYYVWSHIKYVDNENYDSYLWIMDDMEPNPDEGYSYAGNEKYDAATYNWGEDWDTPTKEQMDELYNKCTWTKVEDFNGVTGLNGIKFTSTIEGYTDKYIFLPAAGYYELGTTYSNGVKKAGERIYYFSSTYGGRAYGDGAYRHWAYTLKQNPDEDPENFLVPYVIKDQARTGRSIRPVYKP